jgi:hypothetical protein
MIGISLALDTHLLRINASPSTGVMALAYPAFLRLGALGLLSSDLCLSIRARITPKVSCILKNLGNQAAYSPIRRECRFRGVRAACVKFPFADSSRVGCCHFSRLLPCAKALLFRRHQTWSCLCALAWMNQSPHTCTAIDGRRLLHFVSSAHYGYPQHRRTLQVSLRWRLHARLQNTAEMVLSIVSSSLPAEVE